MGKRLRDGVGFNLLTVALPLFRFGLSCIAFSQTKIFVHLLTCHRGDRPGVRALLDRIAEGVLGRWHDEAESQIRDRLIEGYADTSGGVRSAGLNLPLHDFRGRVGISDECEMC